MSNDERKPNDEIRNAHWRDRASGFVILSSFGIRHSSFTAAVCLREEGDRMSDPKKAVYNRAGSSYLKRAVGQNAPLYMIKVNNLAKVFGAKRAVDGISFSVDRGEVLGFLGPNGAGKSTTMRMITGFIPPSAGTVSVGGFDIVDDPIPARRLIGYLPENAPA